jgi:uncharacterized repeat protein (TIGR03833 family)
VTPQAENVKVQGHGPPPRANIKPGIRALVVQKQDQGSGKTTEGIVEDTLTSSATHPHGIKVRLEGGVVGRVTETVDPR